MGNDLRFCDWQTKEFFIENKEKVPFEFSVNLSQIKRKGLVEVIPMSGKILGGK